MHTVIALGARPVLGRATTLFQELTHAFVGVEIEVRLNAVPRSVECIPSHSCLSSA